MYGHEVNFVGVAGRDEMAAIDDFIATLGVSAFPHVVDEDGSLWTSYGITTQPSFIFIEGSGGTETHIGALGIDGLRKQIDQLVS